MANKYRKTEINLPENERVPLQKKVLDFLHGGDSSTLIIPGLSNLHRKYLHKYAAKNGLQSKSFGSKNNRELHISYKKKVLHTENAHQLKFSNSTREVLADIALNLKDHKNSSAPQHPASRTNGQHMNNVKSKIRAESLLIGLGPRMVPPRPYRISKELFRDKLELPIFQYQDSIRQLLQNHSVIFKKIIKSLIRLLNFRFLLSTVKRDLEKQHKFHSTFLKIQIG